MTSNRVELGAAPSPARRYVVMVDDSLTPALVQRAERHYTSPALAPEDALALASAFTSTVVRTTGKWLLPAAGGQSIVVLQEAP